MRTYRTSAGPFTERPYYELHQIEDICGDELRKVGLYPEKPGPVRIDRFIEKRFGVPPAYEELPKGLLGYTRFGPRGVEEIVVSRTLAEQGTRVSERQVSSTLAHEGGHGLLHAHLFVLERARLQSLFGDDLDPKLPKILCRGPAAPEAARERRQYDGRWWEFQANQTIGALLLPRDLAVAALNGLLARQGTFGRDMLPPERRREATERLSEVFDVNPAVAKIRLQDLFPEESAAQLTL